MIQEKRRPWKDVDNSTLISLWDRVGSVALIALMMKRTRSSVQTQASRLQLPPRNEESDRHRRRWHDADDVLLNKMLEIYTMEDGTIPIEKLSTSMGRSIDAVIARLETNHGEDSDVMRRLVPPPLPEITNHGNKATLFQRPNQATVTDPRKQTKVRRCLRCDKLFVSEGAHNRICPSCKRNENFED